MIIRQIFGASSTVFNMVDRLYIFLHNTRTFSGYEMVL